MQHFGYLSRADTMTLFERPPEPFGPESTTEALSIALGATLYIPANRPSLPQDITKQSLAGATAAVLCLEDAVPDDIVPWAESNLVGALQQLHASRGDRLPLLFVRVRDTGQIPRLVRELGPAVAILAGFVLPKFTADTGPAYLDALDEADERSGRELLVMPVLESGVILHAETRVAELTRLRALLIRHRRRVLAVRIGATDLCALYGLRRSPELSVYDVKVIADLIADVINMLGRTDGTGFTLAGPVWEYFAGPGRLFKPQLRRSPFDEQDRAELRGALVTRSMDGLIREVQMDKANGLIGKTTIHPSHVPVVNALHVVSLEEYRDARDVLEADQMGGVRPSAHGNKMNEIGPHTAWARATMLRSGVYGVAADGVSYVDLLAASLSR
ncbi:MAG: HpcH/HpaI aldolase/citrate lyase family protein [Pseudonocardia sp.]|nr:HpcH/HpaI aldolase/citrate lyase family protein [Pseudonocardia sp.]